MALLILYFCLAVGVSFICSILESVLLSVTMPYVQVLGKNHPGAGRRLLAQKQDINKSIASILILNTVANTLGAAGVGAQAGSLFGSEVVFYVSGILTFVILFFSEIIPKTIGAVFWKQLAPTAAYLIQFFIFITYPIILMTLYVTRHISRNNPGMNSLTKAELIESTLMSEDEGVIDEHEADVIENVLQLDDIKAGDILTPRSVVFALEENKTVREAAEHDNIFQFSRMPVYRGTIDNITGIVLTKKVFQQAVENDSTPIREIKKEIFRINENVPISKVLDLFIKKKEHMFLVVDGYGQTEGIITLEDCIETLLGVEIMDESDTVEDMREYAKQKMKRRRAQGR